MCYPSYKHFPTTILLYNKGAYLSCEGFLFWRICRHFVRQEWKSLPVGPEITMAGRKVKGGFLWKYVYYCGNSQSPLSNLKSEEIRKKK